MHRQVAGCGLGALYRNKKAKLACYLTESAPAHGNQQPMHCPFARRSRDRKWLY